MINKKYKRILIKISGESLMGKQKYGHDSESLKKICSGIKTLHDKSIEICIVIGGGNILRGRDASQNNIERVTADHMGMLATIINSLAIQNILEKDGIDTRLLSAIPMTAICEPFIRRKAIRHMKKSRVVIFAAGTGNPFFSTDTAAALRAIEMRCDALFKGTQVNGVYSEDPKINPNATKYQRISYSDVLNKELKIMDAAAISLARENNIPIIIFSIDELNRLYDLFTGSENNYTIIN
jgi:uridylate kinase